MYNELVKRLREPCQYENCVLCNEAADAIEELSKPRWIPLTEQLPEKDKWVLRYSAITEATWLAYLNSAGVWMDEQGEVHYVTHWMPLQEPPKEEA